MTAIVHHDATALLTSDLQEESEQIQALARSLDLPHRALDPARLLSSNLLHVLVHLATVSASAAAVVDAAEMPSPVHLRALARIESAQQSMLSAGGSMSTVLDQLSVPDSGITDTAGLVQAGRLRASVLLTSASAHLGAAAAALRATPAG
ncbi:hypothetical protein KV557_00295 [Kitasatospora aureofaciens]|uniref:hypothetical protein n=1 Tax=Kitasatospora aureofaciens TaxID=1894 RepID=UPI001C440C7F|nr:hypothetical protein [Kitasatospora aureofaciens]MBV6695566.1 hypothetical protein [Kitasatospora aureofaciens]